MFQKQPPDVFYKKSDLKNFAKFTEKQPSQSLFFNNIAGSGLQLKTPTELFSSES